MSYDSELARIKQAVDMLSEHFDSVQIFTTVVGKESGGTARFSSGAGDWFARYGLVKYWIKEQDAIAFQEGIEDAKD